MKKPAILSICALASIVVALAVPTYNNIQKNLVEPGATADSASPTDGKHWHCVTRSGPDAPNLIVLRNNGHILKLIDHSRVSGNGTRYDLQGIFEITEDRLVANMSSGSGEVFTDTYTVQSTEPGKMRITHAGNGSDTGPGSETEPTSYSCSMLASRS